jgi:hypothetical protein
LREGDAVPDLGERAEAAEARAAQLEELIRARFSERIADAMEIAGA